MITVTVVGAKETAGRLDALKREIPTVLERAVGRASLLIRRELVLQMTGRGRHDAFLGRLGAPPPTLGVRTGHTRARLSPGGQVYRLGDLAVAAVGSPDRHVLAHETGTTITGRPYLRIPLAAAQTPAGQDRFVGRSVRGMRGIFVLKSKRGKLLLARGKGKGLELLYLLARSVRLPARGVFKAVTARVRPTVERMVGAAVSVEVQKANRG